MTRTRMLPISRGSIEKDEDFEWMDWGGLGGPSPPSDSAPILSSQRCLGMIVIRDLVLCRFRRNPLSSVISRNRTFVRGFLVFVEMNEGGWFIDEFWLVIQGIINSTGEREKINHKFWSLGTASWSVHRSRRLLDHLEKWQRFWGSNA